MYAFFLRATEEFSACFSVLPSQSLTVSQEPPLPQRSHGLVRFSALCRRETETKSKLSSLKVCIFFLRQRSASTVAFLREEGVTRRRDGRSPRDWRAANFSFFAPQFVPAKAALFLRGELSAERLTEGCWGSAESGFVPHNRE